MRVLKVRLHNPNFGNEEGYNTPYHATITLPNGSVVEDGMKTNLLPDVTPEELKTWLDFTAICYGADEAVLTADG